MEYLVRTQQGNKDSITYENNKDKSSYLQLNNNNWNFKYNKILKGIIISITS